jgi:hypothetical protein
MSHVRTQIRNAVVALLPGTVHAARVYPVDEATLPVTLVYTNGETDEQSEFRTLGRTLEVMVECVVQASDLDTALDARFIAVEQALADTDLGGLCVSFSLTGIEITLSAEGAAPIGRGRMTYAALYRTSYSDPTTSI